MACFVKKSVCLLLLALLVVAEAEVEGADQVEIHRGRKKVRCENMMYRSCYHIEFYCPNLCEEACEVDRDTCLPVCVTPLTPEGLTDHHLLPSPPPAPLLSPPPPASWWSPQSHHPRTMILRSYIGCRSWLTDPVAVFPAVMVVGVVMK